MEVKKIVVGYLKENCYLIFNNNKVVIVDPGDEAKKIDKEIKGTVIGILITHHHFDHIGALKYFKNKYQVDINNINDADFNYQIILTPGHTKDSKTFYFPNEQLMFTGDFIFENSIGRTDLDSGNNKDMQESLKKIIKYPDNTKIYPGHGSTTILGQEKANLTYFIKNI